MSIYDSLNPCQKEACFCTEGPLLLLAGAGAGKTRVLVHRIAYLIEERGVNPWNIMAITFTNKAAKEMRQRVDDMIGFGAEDIWVSTFHSTCVRILRRYIDLLGYDTNFTIYDTDDQKKVMKELLKRKQIDPKQLPERSVLNAISHAKDQYLTPGQYKNEVRGNFREEKIADLYECYQQELKKNNALDFDDLLFKTVELFEYHPDVLSYWQDRFRYIMVDEYQDTNGVQFLFVKKLAEKYKNLCVVGDDDQSIYRFRGADIRNILEFEEEYENTRVIKLEQNYRSTRNILDVANHVIHHNVGRKDKTLWTENEEGEKVTFCQYEDNYKEAEQVAEAIDRLIEGGENYRDIAILNRTNAQSRVYEEKLLFRNIPYRIIGGVNFYSRMEVKDILSYLKCLVNPNDDQAVKRIINVPKRGIGQTTIDRVQNYALLRGIGFMDAVDMVEDVPELSKAAKTKIQRFGEMMEHFRKMAEQDDLVELYDTILEETGYADLLVAEGTDEAKDRLENLGELKNKIAVYMQEHEHATLSGLLEEVALIADIDNLDADDNRVVIMTIHSAKGLEFPYVFMGGMEDGVFPGYRSISADDSEEIEEERRLCYVGMTRAQKGLYLSAAQRRMMNGQVSYNPVSRFIREIPATLLSVEKRQVSVDAVFQKPAQHPAMTHSYQLKTAAAKDPDTIFDKPSFGTNAAALSYKVGDQVRHIKFGSGVVTEILPAGKDYEVAVDFERCGVKRMFASFAKLKKED
ncbi:MAG: DNA helicase PcrA [Lachnospiraceae bacterium]|nr:DNA helicase PcrA [Lachnospiraceae bacterium]